MLRDYVMFMLVTSLFAFPFALVYVIIERTYTYIIKKYKFDLKFHLLTLLNLLLIAWVPTSSIVTLRFIEVIIIIKVTDFGIILNTMFGTIIWAHLFIYAFSFIMLICYICIFCRKYLGLSWKVLILIIVICLIFLYCHTNLFPFLLFLKNVFL